MLREWSLYVHKNHSISESCSPNERRIDKEHTCFQIQTGMCRDRKSDDSVTRKRNDKRVLFMGDTGNKPIRFVLN